MAVPQSCTLVVHVVPYFFPHEGGQERVAQEISKELAAHGRQVLVLTSNVGAQHAARREVGERLEVRRLRAIEIGHTPLMFGLVPQLFRINSESIVHVHIAQAFIPDLTVLISRLRGMPTVAHYHLDVGPSGPLGFLLEPYQRWVLSRTLRAVDVVLVPTLDYVPIVARLHGVAPQRIVVLPNGTRHAVRSSPRSPGAKVLRLISVGRLSVQKNFALLIDAVAVVRTCYPSLQFELVIHGEGELRSAISAQITRLGLEPWVRLERGYLSQTELAAHYDAADLFVLATTRESFGIVFLEAMSKGLPIVTTDVPGVRNVVRHGRNGLLVQPDPRCMADAIKELATNSSRYEEISSNNLADVREYDWSVIVSRLERIYDDLCRAE